MTRPVLLLAGLLAAVLVGGCAGREQADRPGGTEGAVVCFDGSYEPQGVGAVVPSPPC